MRIEGNVVVDVARCTLPFLGQLARVVHDKCGNVDDDDDDGSGGTFDAATNP